MEEAATDKEPDNNSGNGGTSGQPPGCQRLGGRGCTPSGGGGRRRYPTPVFIALPALVIILVGVL